jgi:hypothetical protein
LFEFVKIYGRITTHNFLQINIIEPKYAYYKIFQMELRYKYSTTLIFHKTKEGCIKNDCLNKLFEFFKISDRITTHNFLKINIITHKYAYYKIFQLEHRYKYSTTLILHKTYVQCIKNYSINKLFEFFKILAA